MSEGRRTPDRPIRNPSWLHSDPRVRTLEWLREHPNPSFQSILDTAINEIRECVRRGLIYSSNSSTESDSPINVINKREFTFGEIDASLLPAASAEIRDTVSNPNNVTRPSLGSCTVSWPDAGNSPWLLTIVVVSIRKKFIALWQPAGLQKPGFLTRKPQ